jgi:prophage DNA circulation protein
MYRTAPDIRFIVTIRSARIAELTRTISRNMTKTKTRRTAKVSDCLQKTLAELAENYKKFEILIAELTALNTAAKFLKEEIEKREQEETDV